MRTLTLTLWIAMLERFPGQLQGLVCREGYYELSGWCFECQSTCTNCTSVINCGGCKPGLYGVLCQHQCSACINNACTIGGCTEGCRDGYYVESFDGSCSQCDYNCVSCTGYQECKTCRVGLFGANCGYSCSGCKNRACSASSCLEGCADGRWGENCDQRCDDACVENTCHRATGLCNNGCQKGFYWSYNICRLCPVCGTCSDNDCKEQCCGDNTQGATTLPANNVTGDVIDNGGGDTNNPDNEAVSHDSAVAIGAGVGGGLVAVAIVVLIVLYLVRRQSGKKTDTSSAPGDVETQRPSPYAIYMTSTGSAPSGQDPYYVQGAVAPGVHYQSASNVQTIQPRVGKLPVRLPDNSVGIYPVTKPPVRHSEDSNAIYDEIVDYDVMPDMSIAEQTTGTHDEQPYLN